MLRAAVQPQTSYQYATGLKHFVEWAWYEYGGPLMTAEEVDAYATLHDEQFAAEFNEWARAIWRKLPAAEAYAPPDDFASIYAETPPDVEGAADAAEEERTEARQSQSQSQEDEEEDGPEGGEGTQVSGEAAAELAECDGDLPAAAEYLRTVVKLEGARIAAAPSGPPRARAKVSPVATLTLTSDSSSNDGTASGTD